MIEELTYHTFQLKRGRVSDAEKELREAREDLRKAEDKIRDLGLNPFRMTQIEFDAARNAAKRIAPGEGGAIKIEQTIKGSEQ